MYYIGVDPGSRLTGVAVYEESDTDTRDDEGFVFHGEFEDPIAVWDTISLYNRQGPLVTILEDMVGSGERDKHIVRTIKIVGYVFYRCKEQGIPVELVTNQRRLAFVRLVPAEIHGKDEIAAAAHVISYRQRSNWS